MKATILIADDSPIIRNIVGHVITDMGHDLLTANDGIAGLIKAFTHFPDLIILDIEMPGINGFQACRLLKNDPLTSHIPIIILTGEKKPISKFWGKEVGADSYIVKSADIDPLSESIASLLKKFKPIDKNKPVKNEEISEKKILIKISHLLDNELMQSTLRKIELESILKNINEAIISIDITNTVKEINNYGMTLFGLDSSKAANIKLKDLLPFKEFLSFEELISIGSAENLLEKEITYRSTDKTHNLLIDFSLIKNFKNETETIVIFFRDITYLKEIEKMKADYFYNVVQEIRNPLTSAKEAILFILNESPEPLNKMQGSVLKIVEDDINRLVRFTDNMINISEMEFSANVLNLEDIGLSKIIYSAYERNKKIAELKNIKFEIKTLSKDLIIYGDREKLIEVFTNIFSNAVKFNKKDGSIFVEISTSPKDGKEWANVVIRDTGVGMDKDELKLLFSKEIKVDARLRKKGGEFGFNMVIANMLIELHQGIIEAKSTPGIGTSISLFFPKKN